MAEKLSDIYDEEHYLYLVFLKPILNDLQMLNKNFQSAKSDPTKLLNDLEYVINKLKKYVIVDDSIDILCNDFESAIVFDCNLGYSFENHLNILTAKDELDSQTLTGIRKTCVNFVVSLIKELISRYSKIV